MAILKESTMDFRTLKLLLRDAFIRRHAGALTSARVDTLIDELNPKELRSLKTALNAIANKH